MVIVIFNEVRAWTGLNNGFWLWHLARWSTCNVH